MSHWVRSAPVGFARVPLARPVLCSGPALAKPGTPRPVRSARLPNVPLGSFGARLASLGALAQCPIGFGRRRLASLGALAQCPIGFGRRRLASLGALAQ